MTPPFISVCIPAKDRAHLLRRLFDSLLLQTYRDFEVVLTDNSADDAVLHLTREYPSLAIRYHRNDPPTEMGGNWNAAMLRAGGTWLKLIHDDDWFADENSLAAWASVATVTKAGFLFSSYDAVDQETGTRTRVAPTAFDRWLLRRSPLNILRKNSVGPPSVTMIRFDAFVPYLDDLKWLVDIESYMRELGRTDFQHIAQPLVCIGVHGEQATNAYFRNPVVEIPETLAMLNPYDPAFCRNVVAYDYCWRLVRNLNLRTVEDFERYAGGQPVPESFIRLIRFQRRFPRAMLQNGLCSKALMMAYWIYFNFFAKTDIRHGA